MNLNELNKLITDKWHICQSDLTIYDEKTAGNKPVIKDRPDKCGLYLCYIWDFRIEPEFHYEILYFDPNYIEGITTIQIQIEFFERIDNTKDQYYGGRVPFSNVLKWMYYDDFCELIEQG